ncbi:hypothetical protein [Acinetobacter gyllenbergii]|uniref:hypothetical protein n=1 Tax=Acinetobacter gyllenbergii TaxID=134534 RepID=UPI003F570949
MDKKLLGNVLGVDIHYPINRDEIRLLIQKQTKFRSRLIDDKDLNDDQIYLEVRDVFDAFTDSLTDEEKSRFETVHMEEVNAAPIEWLSTAEELQGLTIDLNKSKEDTYVAYKDGESIGELFGIQIRYPILRQNVREVVVAKSALAKTMYQDGSMSIYQAFNDLGDIENQFLTSLEEKDSIDFLNLLAEETNAYTSALNDETAKINAEVIQRDIENSNNSIGLAAVVTIVVLLFLFYLVFTK